MAVFWDVTLSVLYKVINVSEEPAALNFYIEDDRSSIV
jgi:hypothetical protein